jgi:6-phosphogluconolactonase
MDANLTPNDGNREIEVVPDAAVLAERAARRFSDVARSAVEARGQFLVALSGGNTPRALYQTLADRFAAQVDWSRVQVFFSDERFVPPTSPDSNYRMSADSLLSHVPISERFVHQVATVDTTPSASAGQYEEGIRRVFHAGLTDVPAFDLILLGLGPDGHTASLFPGTEALSVVDRLVVPNFVPRLDSQRITFTYPLLNAAHCVLFLVEGAGKAERVAEVLAGADLPAAKVHPRAGRLIWLLDQAAAARLPTDGSGT